MPFCKTDPNWYLAILRRYFANGVSPLGLLKEAVVPTLIMFVCFLVLRF